MNAKYALSHRGNLPFSWLLVAVIASISFFLLLQMAHIEYSAASQPAAAQSVSGSRLSPQIQPVPAAPPHQPEPALRSSATPVPAGTQAHFIARPVPTPPAGQ